MLKPIRKDKEGFTIIEVLIVLVIAGLIMLIVFLAVPALQRNSRNTQRKNDVSSLLGAISEWTNNNGGKLPADSTQQGEALANANLGIYAGEVTFASGATTNDTTTANVVVVTGAECEDDGDAADGTTRSFAALYSVETGGDDDPLCQEG